MNKKISLGSALILTSFAVLLTFMITFVNMNNTYNKILADTELNDRITMKLAELDRKVREIFIGEIDNQKLSDAIADGYVKGLGDKYAEYMPAERYTEYLQLTQGRMVGIGVEVMFNEYRGGVIEVTNVTANSPAENGGLLIGDYIYKVEDELISAVGYYEAVSKVKGEEGTNVALTVLRGENYEEEIVLTFTRAEVQVQTVKHEMLQNNTGYIKIREFNQETPNEFKAALDELEALGATGYIFDVRNNGGGDLQGITQTLDYLLPEGPIIRIDYKDSAKEQVIYSDAENELIKPMAVLINENTASAAELFCAALKDYEKATLIGVTTFGKGTVQSINRLSDNSALKLSSARYSPPFSDNYNGIGVTPHTEVKLAEELKKIAIEKLKPEEDAQLQQALKTLE